MVEKEKACVSIDDAARLVGQAMFGDVWVDAITKREKWLLKRYVEGLWDPSPSSILRSLPSSLSDLGCV